MARRPVQPTQDITENVEGQEMSAALDARFTTYAFMTLEERALPDARDGLKPSQRRVLVAMNDLHLNPRGGTEKCAKICGDTSGNYHPHGEAVVYPTMYRLAQNWIMREPLLTGQGNFGNIDGDPPAAMRYTEAKLSPVGAAMLDELSEDVVPFVPNYNEKRKEPTILPAMFPNLLVNGTHGIAVGWATHIPPHNYREVAKAVALYIKKGGAIEAVDVVKVMPGPDFPTGGKLLGQDGVLEYYKTGHGSFRIEGKYEIEKSPRGVESIVITQLPYQTSPEALAIKIKELVEKGTLTGITDLKNLSCKKDGIRVIVEVAKGGNAQLVLNNLLKNTSLRESYSVNATVLIGGKVVPDAGIVKLLGVFVDHRRTVLTAKFNAELAKHQARLHILEGLLSASKRIDEVIKIVRSADDDKDAALKLIAVQIVATQVQADAILAITLRQLTKLEGQKLLDEQTKLNERVGWLNNVLAHKEEIDKIITVEQEELAKKIGTERRTEISASYTDIDNEELVKDEQLVISLTGDGYVKSTSTTQFRVQGRGGQGVAGMDGKHREDNVFEMFESGSKELILFFTNKGLMFKKKAYEIPQASRIAKGTHASNLLNLSEGEHVTNMLPVKSLEEPGYLTIATQKGLIKRSALSEYDTSLKTAGLVAIKLNSGDQVSFVLHTSGDGDVFIVTANGNCVRYNESLITSQGRATQGVRALKLDSDDSIVQIVALDKKAEPDILVVTEGGFGKRTQASEYRAMSGRNVRGYATINKASLKKNGRVVGACPIVLGDSILIASCKGKVIRMDAAAVRATGRATGGVRVVKLDDGDCVSRVTRIMEEDEELDDTESPKRELAPSIRPIGAIAEPQIEADITDDEADAPEPPKAAPKASTPLAAATADNVNAKGMYGYTALHRAAIAGDDAECDRLIALGAKTTVKDNSGKLPWQKAFSAGHEALAEKLKP